MLIFTPIVTLNSRSRVRNEVESRFMRLRCFTTVPNKIYLKESWIASLSLAMTILKIRNVIAKECICTTVAIHFCYLIPFYFVVLLYILITGFIWDSSGNKFRVTCLLYFWGLTHPPFPLQLEL